MVDEGQVGRPSLLKITKLIGLGETLEGGRGAGLRRGNCMDWGRTAELLPSSRTFSVCDLFLTRSILRLLQTAFAFCLPAGIYFEKEGSIFIQTQSSLPEEQKF